MTLVEALKILSVMKLGEPLAISTEAIVAEPEKPSLSQKPVVEPEVIVEPATEHVVEQNLAPQADEKKSKANY
ncbi:hypothetical protein ACLK2H_23355 [Escherichia coli]